MSASYDPNGWSAMLAALRNANDGFVLTIWNPTPDAPIGGWKIWRTLDGEYAERDPGFAMNIPIHELCGELDKVIKEQPAISSGGSY